MEVTVKHDRYNFMPNTITHGLDRNALLLYTYYKWLHLRLIEAINC